MSLSYLACHQLSYHLPNSDLLFTNVDLDIRFGEKAALIGDNGVGKSTLFKIISGELAASSGSIDCRATVALVPQAVHDISGTVGQALGVSQKLRALQKIEAGLAEDDDFVLIGNDWDLTTRLEMALSDWRLDYLDLETDFKRLSGGEKEKLLIIRALLSGAEIILLDEPTNNLDSQSRQFLIQKLSSVPQGVLIVSHDRDLLEKMSVIWELKSSGIKRFGGNYSFYSVEKQRGRELMEAQVNNLQKELNQVASQKTELEQKKSRQNDYGDKQVTKRRYSKIVGNAMKAQADETSATKRKQLDARQELCEKEEYDLRLSLKQDDIKIPLPAKPFIRERLLEIKNLHFGFGSHLLLKDFNLLMRGNDRVAICGANGCGKTTLLKLVSSELMPSAGSLRLNGRAVYLNQDLALLRPELSLVENILELNPKITCNDAYKTLANFKFRNVAAEKLAGVLSGGELLRGCLAAIFCTEEQPDILILDEPTNNLDIRSIEILESALAQYQGALLVVSHDENFLHNIGISRKVSL